MSMMTVDGKVTVVAPSPTFVVPPTPTGPVLVVPVAGPQGVRGNPGPPGPVSGVAAHIESETPHPVYDDGPSLLLLYQNAKV